jgi:hypothetical protein
MIDNTAISTILRYIFLEIVMREITTAMIPPISGAKKINNITFKISVDSITEKPACAIAAPAKPPMSVCDEEEIGRAHV